MSPSSCYLFALNLGIFSLRHRRSSLTQHYAVLLVSGDGRIMYAMCLFTSKLGLTLSGDFYQTDSVSEQMSHTHGFLFFFVFISQQGQQRV